MNRGLWMAGAVLSAVAASAHPISIMTGQALVRTNEVTVKLEVMVEDLMLFQGILLNEEGFLNRSDIEAAKEWHQATLIESFMIRDVEGARLAGEVVRREAAPVPPRGYEVGTLMQHFITYHLRYPLLSPPTHLTFQQVVGREAGMIPATLELEVLQVGMGMPEVVNLSNAGNTETIEFVWDADEGRAGESPAEAWQRRREERKQARMGITSYDSVYGFVYITDREVRTEILIPLATLETWIAVPRRDPFFLEVEEQAAARERLVKFFRGKNRVVIDGIQVQPTLQRLDYYGVRFTDFAMRPEPDRLSVGSARLGAVLSYSTKGPPARVDITWEYFNAAIFSAKTVVYANNETVQRAFTVYRPVFSWNNPDKREWPQIAVIEARKRALTEAEAAELAGVLVRNIYRAFDYHAEGDIYDALAHSVHGPLLADLYLKIRDGLVMQEQGGSMATVQEVHVVQAGAVRRGKDRAFSVVLTWTVEGTVEHWGHIHTRVNQYTAEFSVQPVEAAWKITAMNVTDLRRVRYQVRLRSF